jgi:hypothetical protein
MPNLSDLISTALALQESLDGKEIPFCFIGGLAVQHWGQPRFTADIDATIFVGFGNERNLARQLLTEYRGRIEDALEFAVLNRVLLIEDSQGHPIDLCLGGMPYENEMIGRATYERVSRTQSPVKLCSPSDLVILKTFAGRPQDWIDVRSILVRTGNQLDWKLIQGELEYLLDLKEELQSLDELLKIRQSLES